MRWTRDELLIVLNLYHKLRFGQFHERQPVIMDLASRMGRTPGSVAMKLSNFASLDPVLKLRGIKGLPGASNLDRTIWEEFHDNPAELIPACQERFDALFITNADQAAEVIPNTGIRIRKQPATGTTEAAALVKQRRGQDYFRDVVLNNYGGRCGLTGLPVRELLVASHILPWASHEAARLDVRNGICLNRLHDAAFDQGLIGFDDKYRLLISPKLRQHLPNQFLRDSIIAHEGTSLVVPEDGILPLAAFLAEHRSRFGIHL